MSKTNDLATILDELTSVATQLKMIAQDLITTTVDLRNTIGLEAYEKSTSCGQDNNTLPDTDAHETSASQVIETPTSQSTPEEPQYTKETIRAMLADLAQDGHREDAKALVAKYASGGSFSDIDPGRYPELAEEVQKLYA